jgi:hypothetical protein
MFQQVKNKIMRYSLAGIVTGVTMLLLSCQGCQSGQKGPKPDPSIVEAEKPQVDSSRVIEMLDLYRAKRYEDLQGGLAAGPEQVYKISFHGRQMRSLSPKIARFSYLAALDVSYNGLTELPDELSSLHYLQGFYAGGNQLAEFPSQLLLLPLLARLNLSENQIAEIPPEIMKMDQLDYLNLEKNRIVRIPVQLYELDGMTALNLAENGLSDLPEGISQLASLRKLDLSKNQLNTLPRELAIMGNHLEELDIHGNNIPMEEIEWLIEAMPATKIRY